MTVFVDTSIWYAAANSDDADNQRAKIVLAADAQFLTSTFVLTETWRLLQHRVHWHAAESFWRSVRRRPALIEQVTAGDLEMAWLIGQRFRDQEFSLTDRTSFALMERLGIRTVATFDRDFAVYRFGWKSTEAFNLVQ